MASEEYYMRYILGLDGTIGKDHTWTQVNNLFYIYHAVGIIIRIKYTFWQKNLNFNLETEKYENMMVYSIYSKPINIQFIITGYQPQWKSY